MPLNFLFIYNDFFIGGIQTQILEQCRCISDKGDRAKVLLLTRQYDNALLSQLDSVAEVIFFDQLTKFHKIQIKMGVRGLLFYLLFPLKKVIANEFFSDVKFCHVSNLVGYLYSAILLQRGYMKSAVISFGLYHSAEIKLCEGDSGFIRKLINSLEFFPSSNIISTGAVTQELIADFYKQDVLSIKLLKMGVPLHNTFIKKTRGNCFKILSIGRLAEFKTYNLMCLNVVKKLVSMGYNIRYDIVGEGPLYIEIVNRVAELQLEKNVSLIGNIEYSKLSSTIDGADCFIGSGTVLILSSGRSCPSIIGIDSNPIATTYGFLQDTRGQYINERNLEYPEKDIMDVVERLIKCDADEYDSVRFASFERAQEFSLSNSFKSFVEYHNNMAPFIGLRKRVVFGIYLSLVFSIIGSFIISKNKVSKIYE